LVNATDEFPSAIFLETMTKVVAETA
jgi:hypothetical protein